ncbi:hypothetical protein QOZ80_3AG0225860 [Eleusine coracana subsp. coracana]|nr:hypothetical protein QOZ80_3AG0225860 [Eleusine coracana subsp. coracana]
MLEVQTSSLAMGPSGWSARLAVVDHAVGSQPGCRGGMSARVVMGTTGKALVLLAARTALGTAIVALTTWATIATANTEGASSTTAVEAIAWATAMAPWVEEGASEGAVKEVGSLVITKKALFLLSNVIFLFLAADCCRFFTVGASTSDFDACEPGDGLAEQAQHHQGAEQCATQTFVSYSVGCGLRHKTQSSPSDNCTHLVKDNHAGIRADVRMSDNAIPLERHEEQDVPVLPTLELFKLDDDDDEAADNVTLETVVTEEQEPTFRTAQELEKLDIDELNKKFEEFIRSRRIKWVEEQGYLKWQEKGDNTSALLLAC